MSGNGRLPMREHLAVLDLLRRAPFLSMDDLVCELERPPFALVRALRQRRWVDRVTRPGVAATGPSELYYVTPVGLEVLTQRAPRSSASGPVGDATRTGLLLLLPRLDRLVWGHALLRKLLAHAPAALQVHGQVPRCRWTWIRDYQQSLPALKQSHYKDQARLFADWLIILHVDRGGGQEEHYPFFLVLDHACLPPQQIRQRLSTLFHARAAAAHAHPEQVFPPVLIVLPGLHRARHWQRLAADLTRAQESPLRGGLAVVPFPFQGEPGNFWRLPWQSLSRYGPCALPDLLVSGAATALPQTWCAPSHHCWGTPRAPEATTRAVSVPALQPESLRVAHLSKLLKEEGRSTSLPTLCLLGLKLERSHYRILELLGEFPLLTEANMAAVLGMQEPSLRQYLRELRPYQCLETERFSEEAQLRWRLSSRGLHLLALRHRIQLRKLTTATGTLPGESAQRVQKGLAVLRQHAALTAGVYAFFARLASESRQHDGHQLLWWETAYTREHSYYALSRRAWRLEKPHGIGEYRAGDQRVRFWVEWHGRWHGKEHFLQKIAGYAASIRSNEWRREGHVLPALLLVAPDGARELQIQQMTRTMFQSLRPVPVVLTTTVELCNEHGPLAAIWELVLSPLPEEGPHRRPFYDLRIRKAVE